MNFTQFLMPNGERRPVQIERPADIEAKAAKLVEAGCKFEIEILRTGEVNMDCTKEDEPLSGELCNNGPEVPDHVDKLVNTAYAMVFKE